MERRPGDNPAAPREWENRTPSAGKSATAARGGAIRPSEHRLLTASLNVTPNSLAAPASRQGRCRSSRPGRRLLATCAETDAEEGVIAIDGLAIIPGIRDNPLVSR